MDFTESELVDCIDSGFVKWIESCELFRFRFMYCTDSELLNCNEFCELH